MSFAEEESTIACVENNALRYDRRRSSHWVSRLRCDALIFTDGGLLRTVRTSTMALCDFGTVYKCFTYLLTYCVFDAGYLPMLQIVLRSDFSTLPTSSLTPTQKNALLIPWIWWQSVSRMPTTSAYIAAYCTYFLFIIFTHCHVTVWVFRVTPNLLIIISVRLSRNAQRGSFEGEIHRDGEARGISERSKKVTV